MFETIPVRVILSDIDDAEKRKRVYLGNISQFEIDPNARLRLYAEIFPEYFRETRTDGQQTDTASDEHMPYDAQKLRQWYQ